LPEVLGISDRILVMRGGQISGELAREEANEEKVLGLALPAEEIAR
jgi:L-arabinose transport system ATP-binding protein